MKIEIKWRGYKVFLFKFFVNHNHSSQARSDKPVPVPDEQISFAYRLMQQAAIRRQERKEEAKQELSNELIKLGLPGNVYLSGSASLEEVLDYIEKDMMDLADQGSIRYNFSNQRGVYIASPRGDIEDEELCDFPHWPKGQYEDTRTKLAKRLIDNIVVDFTIRHPEFLRYNGLSPANLVEGPYPRIEHTEHYIDFVWRIK